MSHRTPSHYYEKHYLFKHDPSCFRILLTFNSLPTYIPCHVHLEYALGYLRPNICAGG